MIWVASSSDLCILRKPKIKKLHLLKGFFGQNVDSIAFLEHFKTYHDPKI